MPTPKQQVFNTTLLTPMLEREIATFARVNGILKTQQAYGINLALLLYILGKYPEDEKA